MTTTKRSADQRPTGGDSDEGLSLAPLRGLRPDADGPALAALLCPPYDVIDPVTRAALLSNDPDNAVAVVLPEPTPVGYASAAATLEHWVTSGRYRVDEQPTLYVYEMRSGDKVTRGLLGAVELRDPVDGVILPHESTMAGPVADRLAVMTTTGTDLEPIYLIYAGGGAASRLVASVGDTEPTATATTPDGVRHRLWTITDPAAHEAIRTDLAPRRALIADGHHRYATYRERQRTLRAERGSGPWDRGLALLVDSSEFGPQVHAIHRVVPGLTLAIAVDRLADLAETTPLSADVAGALDTAAQVAGFAVVLTDGTEAVLVTDPQRHLTLAAHRRDEPSVLGDLDVTVVHRGLVANAWQLPDTVETVRYAHSPQEAVQDAVDGHGIAILLRPTPIAAVAAVAAAGARMPRKSTLFTPKPASGLVLRRLADQPR